jgi:hypothetical protein
MKTPTLLIVDARVRYWEDAHVNGIEDKDGTLIPFREGDSWKPVIEVATGKVRDWPQGMTADIHYKVCDAGEYWLADEHGQKFAHKEGYVPDVLDVTGESCGDYIILHVDETGLIEGWNPAAVDGDEWEQIL